jgi:hypothetical protein
MGEGGLPELRKKLRQAVRSEWARPEMITASDALEKIADAIVDSYKSCAAGTEPIITCYKKAAEAAGLGAAYKRAWGKA